MERQEAEESLRVIRSLMEKATIYRAISAPTALVGGFITMVVSAVLLTLPPAQSENAEIFFGVWFGVLAITVVANAWFVRKDALRRGERFISPGMKMALWALLPSHLTAAFVTGLAFLAGGVSHGVLPMLWCLFYGLGLLATTHFAPSSIRKLGWCFVGFGLFAIAVVTMGLVCLSVPLLSHGLMGISFGLFHLIYSVCTWPRVKADEVVG